MVGKIKGEIMNVIFITSFMFIGIMLIIAISVEAVEAIYNIKERYADED
jgi:hypothetical protein